MDNITQTSRSTKVAIGILVVVLCGTVGFLAFLSLTQHERLESIQSQLASTTSQLHDTRATLQQSQQESGQLAERLQDKEQEVEDLEEDLSEASENVELLTKLQTIDPELLKKYSKVYFLNEHYRPSKLTLIDDTYWHPEGDDEFIHEQVWPFLEELLEEAEDDGIDLRIVSAFRNFDRQRELKSHYDVTYGEGTANQFSAAQGYSEHQLGTTVDFTTEELGDAFTQINQTEAYEWLEDNAWKFGFVLSYPENNSYYQFEPWHWRFVGKELAEYIHDNDTTFYDMDQRKIDSYRLELFED